MGCRLAGKMGFLAGWVVALVTVLVGASAAVATPMMTVEYEWSISNYNPSTPQNELLIQYLVTNTSEHSSANNMIRFTLPSGSNSGVYDFAAPNGWSGVITQSETVFTGNGNYIPAGGEGLFELYSTDTGMHQDNATAMAAGNCYDIPFAPVPVDVPGDLHTLAGDISGDGIVDANDVGMMAENWLAEGAGNVADISAGGLVDFVDFALLANDWGKQEPWYVP
jgi:hypothetical protein